MPSFLVLEGTGCLKLYVLASSSLPVDLAINTGVSVTSDKRCMPSKVMDLYGVSGSKIRMAVRRLYGSNEYYSVVYLTRVLQCCISD